MPNNSTQLVNMIDHDIFSEMREMLEDEFDELLEEFKEDTQATLVQLNDAVKKGELERISGLCHTLASSSGHLGFLQLSQIAREIELMAREQHQGNYVELVDQLKQCYQQLIQELEA